MSEAELLLEELEQDMKSLLVVTELIAKINPKIRLAQIGTIKDKIKLGKAINLGNREGIEPL